jgi:hypothetical protein
MAGDRHEAQAPQLESGRTGPPSEMRVGGAGGRNDKSPPRGIIRNATSPYEPETLDKSVRLGYELRRWGTKPRVAEYAPCGKDSSCRVVSGEERTILGKGLTC